MVWLGVDLGESRIGLALSTPELTIAYAIDPVYVHGDSFQGLDDVVEIIIDKRVAHVVVGLPLHLNGTAGKSAKKAQRWCKQLQVRLERAGVTDVTTTMQDERMTTVTAHQQLSQAGLSMRSHREYVDSQSAVIILEAALQSSNNDV